MQFLYCQKMMNSKNRMIKKEYILAKKQLANIYSTASNIQLIVPTFLISLITRK